MKNGRLSERGSEVLTIHGSGAEMKRNFVNLPSFAKTQK
jgi:hypothetical protein